MTMEVDIVIVGAGISGLTAAYTIAKRDPNLTYVVLEAKDRVGGRTLSVPLKTGSGTDIFDLGGQWIGSTQVDIMDLLKELGLDTYRQFISGRKFMQLGGDKISSYTSTIPSLSVISLIELDRFMKKIDKMALAVNIQDPYKCPKASTWDSMTVETFVNQQMWTKAARDAIISATRCMMGVELSQISLLYYLSYINAAGSLQKLIEATENCGQEFKIKGGAQQISKTLVTKLEKDSVKLSQPVSSIEQTKDNINVTTVKGILYRCRAVIMATPPNMTNKISFNPNLPVPKREIIKRMPVSLLTKVIITYEKCFWREAGHSGEIVTIGGPSSVSGCDEGPLCIVYDATSSNHNPALVAFIGGKQAVQWQQQSAADRQSAVLKSLSSFFGDEAWNYCDYREQDWGLEPYTEGSPVCSATPGSMSYFVSGLRDPCDRVYFAGTESATRWCGFMNGAVQAGKRAAFQVIYRFHPQAVSYTELNEAFVVSRTDLKKRKPRQSRFCLKLTVGMGSLIGVGILITLYYRKK